MTNERYAYICLRLGLLAVIIAACFWVIWSLYYAPIPDHDQGIIELAKEAVFTVHISRWFDTLFVFLIVNVLAWALRLVYLATPNTNKENFWFGLVSWLVFPIFYSVIGFVGGLAIAAFDYVLYSEYYSLKYAQKIAMDDFKSVIVFCSAVGLVGGVVQLFTFPKQYGLDLRNIFAAKDEG